MSRVEILKNVKTFFKVRDDWRFNNLTRWLGHKAAHGRELAHLGWRPTRTRVRHHVDRVDWLSASLIIFLHCRNTAHHLLREFIRAFCPCINDFVVFFTLRDQTVIKLLFVILNERPRFANNSRLRVRDQHVVLAEGNTGAERIRETQLHDPIAEKNRLFLTTVTINRINGV